MVAQKIKELARTNQELSAAREFLKKEILKQTKQLREEKAKLAEIIAQKTADLEEKNIILQKRISELEKFYRKAVERELKITKLKEELSKLSQS